MTEFLHFFTKVTSLAFVLVAAVTSGLIAWYIYTNVEKIVSNRNKYVDALLTFLGWGVFYSFIAWHISTQPDFLFFKHMALGAIAFIIFMIIQQVLWELWTQRTKTGKKMLLFFKKHKITRAFFMWGLYLLELGIALSILDSIVGLQ